MLSEDLDRNLQAVFPKLFPMPPESSKKLWGFECEDGWYQLIYNACQQIQNHADKGAVDKQPEMRQVKEKFGTLRVYYANSDQYTDGVVDFAEAHSAYVCEMCGSPGRLLSIKGWQKTLCVDHFQELAENYQ